MTNQNERENEGGAPAESSVSEETPEEARREALKKMGRYAAYTAPALLALLTSKQAAALSVCDRRLKRDVREVGILPDGLKLYAFRYWNDERTFVSVMAQDLLEDERFRHAVVEDASGYYLVDLGALGLDVVGSRKEFMEAGQRAFAEAEPLAH